MKLQAKQGLSKVGDNSPRSSLQIQTGTRLHSNEMKTCWCSTSSR